MLKTFYSFVFIMNSCTRSREKNSTLLIIFTLAIPLTHLLIKSILIKLVEMWLINSNRISFDLG